MVAPGLTAGRLFFWDLCFSFGVCGAGVRQAGLGGARASKSRRNRYQSWTPRLLKAAYNYQFVAKDTGAYSHNPHYAIQLLQDSMTDLGKVVGIDVSGLIRP